jgi:hypothetical protein
MKKSTRQQARVDELSAVDNRHHRQTGSMGRVSLAPLLHDVVMLMQLRAGEEVCEIVVRSAAMHCVHAEVAGEGEGVDLAGETGESAAASRLPVEDVNVCRVAT